MDLVDKLAQERWLTGKEFKTLLITENENLRAKLFQTAQQVALANFGNKIYIRGLIEFTNHCQRDCLYCGLRCSNKHLERYRLTNEAILSCCQAGYALGFRTFVLQGGEDRYYSDDVMCRLVAAMRTAFPDCAITLSLGERSFQSYKRLFEAGANRYLLRHETADALHYSRLHPPSYSLAARMECLYALKAIGYQVGTGFMVGSPYQLTDYFLDDLEFIKTLNPAMVGIGPFLPNKDTPFRHQKPGSLEDTIRLLAILRLMLPKALIPATTALATLHPMGRQYGILAGANVVMPNLSPLEAREKYTLYDGIVHTGAEAAESLKLLNSQLNSFGYELTVDRGDYQG